MQPTPIAANETVIGKVLAKFAVGDPAVFELIAEHIDFRIDHFRDDEGETSWQHATTREGLMSVVARLGVDVFPRGTKPLGVDCFALGGGWVLTRFHQRFFYGVRQRDVSSVTFIITHEMDGALDYFRETVTGIENVA